MKREYDITIDYVNFPLHPETPVEGLALLDLFGGPSAAPRLEAAKARLKALAAEEDLRMGDRDSTYNSRLAQELGVWAERQGKGPEFHLAAFQAYFVSARNLARRDVLIDIARDAGLDVEEAGIVIDDRVYRSEVDAQWERATGAGVTGVPTFACGGGRVVGAQPYEVLAELLESAGAVRRDSRPSE